MCMSVEREGTRYGLVSVVVLPNFAAKLFAFKDDSHTLHLYKLPRCAYVYSLPSH